MKLVLLLAACTILAAPAFADDQHGHAERYGQTEQHRARAEQHHAQAAQHQARQAVHQADRRIETAHKDRAQANRQIQRAHQASAQAQHQTRHYNNVVRQEHRQTQQARRDYSRWHKNMTASRRFQAGAYQRPAGWTYRRWSYGQTLPAPYRTGHYILSSFAGFGLMVPPEGAMWVRYGSDALLVDQESGEIIQTEYNVFY